MHKCCEIIFMISGSAALRLFTLTSDEMFHALFQSLYDLDEIFWKCMITSYLIYGISVELLGQDLKCCISELHTRLGNFKFCFLHLFREDYKTCEL
jgi:hypothetical protein